MSLGPSEALRAKWKSALAAVRIAPKDAQASRAEYIYTHGYEPKDGIWAVPRKWYPKHATLLGEIRWIEYVSKKKFEGPRTFIFNHKHEIERRPYIARGYNDFGERCFLIVGGGYKITAHGIEDDPDDRRDVPGPGTPSFTVPRAMPKHVVGMGKMFGVGYEDASGEAELDLSDAGLVLAYVREPHGSLYIVPDR